MSKKQTHGSRNQELSEKLYKEGKFLDWSITTAFYSVIHYIEDKLLPYTHRDGTICKNVGELKNCLNKKNAHAARRDMIKRHGNSHLYNNYDYIEQRAHEFRYLEYKVDKQIAALVQKKMKEIKNLLYE